VNLITALLRLKSHIYYVKESFEFNYCLTLTHPTTMSLVSLSASFLRAQNGSKEIPENCTNIYNADRKQRLQSYLVRSLSSFTYLRALSSFTQMELDGIDLAEDEEDRLFTQLSVDTVYASYAAAQNRVRQYTQLLMLLKREEDLWAQRVEKARDVLPEYKSRWLPDFQES
jgi:hypothetical protein